MIGFVIEHQPHVTFVTRAPSLHVRRGAAEPVMSAGGERGRRRHGSRRRYIGVIAKAQRVPEGAPRIARLTAFSASGRLSVIHATPSSRFSLEVPLGLHRHESVATVWM
jgi:hypothetical protein